MLLMVGLFVIYLCANRIMCENLNLHSLILLGHQGAAKTQHLHIITL